MHCIISNRIVSYRIAPTRCMGCTRRIALHRRASHCITSHRPPMTGGHAVHRISLQGPHHLGGPAAHRIASHRIASETIASYRIVSPPPPTGCARRIASHCISHRPSPGRHAAELIASHLIASHQHRTIRTSLVLQHAVSQWPHGNSEACAQQNCKNMYEQLYGSEVTKAARPKGVHNDCAAFLFLRAWTTALMGPIDGLCMMEIWFTWPGNWIPRKLFSREILIPPY